MRRPGLIDEAYDQWLHTEYATVLYTWGGIQASVVSRIRLIITHIISRPPEECAFERWMVTMMTGGIGWKIRAKDTWSSSIKCVYWIRDRARRSDFDWTDILFESVHSEERQYVLHSDTRLILFNVRALAGWIVGCLVRESNANSRHIEMAKKHKYSKVIDLQRCHMCRLVRLWFDIGFQRFIITSIPAACHWPNVVWKKLVL